MAMKKDDLKKEERFSESNSSINTARQLRLYYVRIHDAQERLKLQADFGNKIAFMFDKGKQLDHNSSSSPFIYTLDLILKKEPNEQLNIQQDNRFKPAGKFYIQGARSFIKFGTITYDEKDNEGHALNDYFESRYYFLLGIQFGSKLSSNFPGLNSNVFSDFCLFTCFLLNERVYDIFDILIDQFQTFLVTKPIPFTIFDFNDFFEHCNQHLINILNNSNEKSTTLKIILRMIGSLSISKESFNRLNKCSNDFANRIMMDVRRDFNMLYQSVNENERLLFKNGLIELLCIELVYDKRCSPNKNEVAFLQQMPNEKERQDIASQLFCQLYQLNFPIFGNLNWTELFIIVDPAKIKIEYLNFANSLEAFTQCIINISKILLDCSRFQEKIKDYFEKRISNGRIQIDLDGILSLLTFLENKPSDDNFLTFVQSTIEESSNLTLKIKDYFQYLKITTKNMEQVSHILACISKHQFLNDIDRIKLFQKTLIHCKSNDDYITWFEYFLANGKIWMNIYSNLRKQYFEKWTSKAVYNFQNLTYVLRVTDKLISSFDKSMVNDEFQIIFITDLVQLCFYQDDIYHVIKDGLINVQNGSFRMMFLQSYNELLKDKKPEVFKEITNDINPLSKLIKLNQKSQYQSVLIHDLIQTICDRIEITKNELLDAIFNKPTKTTFIYIVLFEESFNNIPIRMKIIKELIVIWEDWEKNGCQVAETQTWNRLKINQRHVVCDIWKRTGEIIEETISFESFITEANRKVQTILKIKENIKICLEYYCRGTYDINIYMNLIQKLDEEANRETVETFNLPDELHQIEQFAIYLNTLIKSYAWANFLKEEIESKISDYNLIFESNADVIHVTYHHETCLETLSIISKIFDIFIEHLNHICSDQQQSLFSQLKEFFPEKQLISTELNVMKSLLVGNTMSRLEKLLDYWKNQEDIIYFSKGCMNLCTKYNIQIQDKLIVLQDILKMNDETSTETCLKVYQNYCTHYLNKYSDLMIKLLTQWNSSYELLEFLYPFAATDVDDLLEVVNDWDEASMNTKTVLDFVMLKRFILTLNMKIESIRTEKPLVFDDIITCFQEIMNKNEFDNVLSSFKSCSENLITIQRICMESKNKEQSKKKRILDMMNNSQFCFCFHRSNETIYMCDYQFDVHITNTNWKPISFSDLNDLRDRARLIQYAQSNGNNLQNYTEDHIQQLQLFISLIDTIEGILQSFISLYVAGYPVVKQYPMARRKFACIEGKYDELENFKGTLEVQIANWEKELCVKYKKCLNLTYLSFQQISMIEDSIHKQTLTRPNDSMYHLLKFMNIDPISIQPILFQAKNEHPTDLLENVAAVLKAKHDIRNFPSQEDEKNNKKILLVETTTNGILRAILSLFHLNDTFPPVANQLFYCTRYTNWIEIRAFIYRCFYSQTLHQLIQPELLSIVIQDQFAQLLNELILQSPKHFFRLGIITNVSSSHLYLINSLKARRSIETICDYDLLSESILRNSIRELIGDRCMMVTSKIAGLGKSTFIQDEIQRLEKTQITFPISGDMSIDTLMKRLRDGKIQLASSTVALHINIGPIENVQQLNEFLYSLIIFRCFRFGQIPVDVPANIPIYIELDSSSYLSRLVDEIVIFKYLQKKDIDSMDWNKLKSDSPTIQFVTNYLQAIDDETINTTEINAQALAPLEQSICIPLLQKYFLLEKNPEFISWTQLSIFTSVYHTLFSGFSNCGYFLVDNFGNSSSLRKDILNSLLNSSAQFTSLSVETAFQNQRSIHNNETVFALNDAIIRWDKSQPFTVIFTDSNDPLFVYKKREDVPQSLIDALRLYYQLINTRHSEKTVVKRNIFTLFMKRKSKNDVKSLKLTAEQQLQELLIEPNQLTHEKFFLRLTTLSNKYRIQKSICLTCFKQYDYTEEQCTSCPIGSFLIRPSASGKDEDIEDFQKLIAAKLQSEYIITPDNYIKMLLIYLRVQSNLPVLIMGETGCGKTALIQFLCQKILDDEMLIFHIHAGVTSEQIVDRMHEFSDKAHKHWALEERKRIWIFFDEFNTTPNIGLLKEIICERTLLGESLPENMVFLGACNPQRCEKNKKESDDNIGVKKYHLLYSVVPIPETMLEYVWDYGSLDDATEKTYIETMLNVCRLPPDDVSWRQCVVKLISESQKYIRRSEDVSSVSLRDVSRFCRFYDWFYKSTILIEESQVSTPYTFNFVERSTLLALFLCYYFRLDSSIKRKEYMQFVGDCIKEFRPTKPFESIDKILQYEKMNLVNRMELPPGTAKNRALTDNIFVLFTCILNRIPVILCGKPGCSKTSAVQIVISNLRGKSSKDIFFRSQQELIAVSYQGSQNCTSDSIIKVFERADKYADANKQIELLPVIVFDEIGLAELSPHNPLKVLHNELEIEKCRHGFVGLSNWRLDASKMNRAVYLACPEPDLEDLKITANSLSESMASEAGQTNPLDNTMIKALAFVYMEMCNHMKKQKNNQQYFGLRDYYSFIKGIVRDLLPKDNKEQDLYKIVRHHLSCNFDGITDGSKFMWSKFCEHMHQEDKIAQYPVPTFDQLLDHSLSSRNGRFLMLIGNSESTFDYLQQYINMKHPSIQTRTLIGSTLENDLLSNTIYTEQYNTRVLMDIILYAEKEITLFLRGLGHLYDNLYDLFNQSYAISARKKYCRIALDSIYHPRCLINDEFYCVVFVKQQDLDKYDGPFLNRFEKHLIDIDSLIDEHHQTVVSSLTQWINQLLPNDKIAFERDLFVWSRPNYILGLVTEAFNYFEQSNNSIDVLTYCQDQLLRISSFDLPLLLSLETKNDHNTIIQQYYQLHNDLSFASFINEEFEQKKKTKLLIYTYTQIYHRIDYSGITNHQDWIEEIMLSYFKTELELMKKLKMHNSRESKSLLCIRVDYHRDHQHIPMLKHVLLNEQMSNVNQGICLIFHLQRCELSHTNNDVFFDEWSRMMIDDLETHQLIPKNILMNPSYVDLITHMDFFNLDKKFDELISGCIIKLHYTVTNKDDEMKINERRSVIIKQCTLKDDQSLRSLLKKQLIEMIRNMVANQFNDWRQDLFTNGITSGSSRSFNDALMKTLFNFLDSYLSVLFLYLEKYSLIDSYLFLIQSDEQIRTKLRSFWSACWTMIIKKIDMSIYTNIPLVFDLHLPCAMIEYEIICQIRQTIVQNNNENSIDSAYKQLISTSIYGEFINQILQDPDLFYHYYHDQLTLTRNEANIQHLSTSFVQHLLTSKIPGTDKDQLRHLFIDYEQLFEIMKLFEISKPLFGNEDLILKRLDQQFLIDRNDINLYRLVIKESDFYLIDPGSREIPDEKFQSRADPFIETCLMNLIEILVSLPIIQSINSIEQLITIYNLFTQCLIRLNYYDSYEVKNFEKFNSVLRLASCISTLFPADKALRVFKHVYAYNNESNIFASRDQINKFIIYLKNIISQEQSFVDKRIIHEILLKFENELVINWFIGHIDRYNDILDFINKSDRNLWAYSAKIFTLINQNLDLSSEIKNNQGQISQNGEFDQINRYLSQLDDPTRKIEILMSTRIYTQLVLDENYQPKIIHEEHSQIIQILKQNFNYFKDNLNELNNISNDQRLELISLIAWLRYYLLYYIVALKNDFKDNIMEKIDRNLVNNTSAFSSTIKLYIIKQLCLSENITFYNLSHRYINRNLVWMKSMITRQNIILPLPLFDEFQCIDKILSVPISPNEMKELIYRCSEKQNTAYCFLIWFIHHYTRFYMNNVSPSDQFIRFMESEVRIELINYFGWIGYHFIYSLCDNFNKTSYFCLDPSMSEEDLHQRLIVLNIIALLISFKCNTTTSTFRFLLSEENLRRPNYVEHFRKLSNLIGVALANDPALQQMIHIRTLINNQNKSKIDIFRCSSECSWLFYIENSILLDEHKQCSLCAKETNISGNGNLFMMNQPHIPMDQNQTLEFISRYIEEHEYKHYLNLAEKPSHLIQPISYHFINFLINAIFLFLHELKYMPGTTPVICNYFRKSIQTKYISFRKYLSDSNQFYIWFYKLFNHMIDTNITIQGDLKTPESILQFEKSIEEQLILPHINSVIKEIREYKLVYINGNDKQNEMISFVEELIENNDQYPLLKFFNITNIHSINIVEHFHNQLQLQYNYEKTYPLTTFLFKRLADYDNIPHLYPLIKFTNYFIQKFNYRIERENAKTMKISQFLNDHTDLKTIYEQFENAWFKINLKNVYFNQEKYSFQHFTSKYDFSNKINLSMFLLNKESILPIACLQTLGNLQNEILDYFHSYEDHHHVIPLQSIQQKHLFDFDIDRMRKILFETGLMINYRYGLSEEIIYDFNEIELTLRNEISCLPKIDMKNIRYFNYQFEFYDENMSLINDIRQQFEQKLFEDQQRREIKQNIDSLDNNSCLEISGSLEYILTYLQNVNNQNIIQIFTIEKFINEYIHSNGFIDQKLKKGLLASISLEYIIDLYELNEECIFEKILAKNIRNQLSEESFSLQERTKISQQFIETIFLNEDLAKSLKDFNIWISMFKRLLVRLLLPKMNINFESSLYDYIKRTDMWKGNITANDIQTIKIKENIPLMYTFIILKGLEAKLKSNEMQQNTMNNEDDEEEYEKPAIRPTRTSDRKEPKSRNNLRLAGRQRRT